MLFGLAPALQAVRHGSGEDLKLNPRTVAGAGPRRGLKDGLIAMQVALSLLLLVAGGLFIRTIQNLRSQDVGFRAANVLSVQIGSQREYRPPWASVIVRLLRRTEAIPGVKVASVSFVETLADDGSGISGLEFAGYPQAEDQRARANWVGPGYFKTSGIPLLEGREFSQADDYRAQKVAIINQAMARHYFGNRSCRGATIRVE